MAFPPTDHLPHRPLILLIEDHEDTCELYETALQAFGFDTVCAVRGERGFDLAVNHRPDAIAMDISLPDIDGYDLLTRLKDDVRTASIPVVVSGHALPDSQQRARDAGCADYLTKPCLPDDLARHLHAVISAAAS
jgi:two-component system cell cycle response regulator DivK